ncbi:hypothetical protein NONO_c60400 [Nocardia nova SH22a]|uniref:Uncharacterized protein n=1 Tax=Nocardia nova SH22a TaxID=1415166 RepID=W5TUE2_9NOCA|nr:hypothetical protein NONO_c60400 [Nocardia nova SH22a]
MSVAPGLFVAAGVRLLGQAVKRRCEISSGAASMIRYSVGTSGAEIRGSFTFG